eukprot:4163912-Amphidinium_carterae.1
MPECSASPDHINSALTWSVATHESIRCQPMNSSTYPFRSVVQSCNNLMSSFALSTMSNWSMVVAMPSTMMSSPQSAASESRSRL